MSPETVSAGASPHLQEHGHPGSPPTQRLVLRTVGTENVEGMDFGAVADLIKAAGECQC